MSQWPIVDTDELAQLVRSPDEAARQAARDRQLTLTKPAGALGKLEDISVWLSGVQGTCPPRPLDDVRVVVVAGDHGVARTASTSAYPSEVTAQMVVNFVRGGAAVNVLARANSASVTVLDISVDADPALYGEVPESLTRYRLRRSSGSIDREDAMTRDEALTALSAGVEIARDAAASGADLLIIGDMGIGNTTPCAVIVGVVTRSDPASIVGRGTGIDDLGWMRKCAAVRDGMRRGREHQYDPIALLATVGGADLAVVTGMLVGAAAHQLPVLLDGVVTCACALLAHRIAPGASDWWIASHLSTEPAAQAALNHLHLTPLLDLQMRLGEGTGALMALPLLRAAQATLSEMATFDEAGVTDRGTD